MRNHFLNLGIAFPCCISVNNCICHFSPLTNDPDTILKAGDVTKIDLGAHIDGFIAVVAHTGIIYSPPYTYVITMPNSDL